MLWKSGWLVNSLKYRVEKDVRDTLFKNDVFLRNRWSLPERGETNWTSEETNGN